MKEKKSVFVLSIMGLILSLVGGLALFAESAEQRTVLAAHQKNGWIPVGQMGDLQSCADGVDAARALQTPVPVTPGPTATVDPDAPTPTPAPPGPTPLPAPQEDNVGFPEDYPNNFKLLFLFDRPDNKQVRVICGNDIAASRATGEPFPYGSILVMETWRAQLDDTGAPALDEAGHYIRSTLSGVFIQRKEAGFGEAYGENRSGEWEYIAYRPDSSVLIPPPRTANCAICHLQQAGEAADFVFRMELYHEGMDAVMMAEDAEDNTVVIDLYAFAPQTITVQKGATVTWVNYDEANHTVESVDGLFTSEVLRSAWAAEGEPDSFSFTFDEVGSYEYFCSIHPAMTGVVEVVE